MHLRVGYPEEAMEVVMLNFSRELRGWGYFFISLIVGGTLVYRLITGPVLTFQFNFISSPAKAEGHNESYQPGLAGPTEAL